MPLLSLNPTILNAHLPSIRTEVAALQAAINSLEQQGKSLLATYEQDVLAQRLINQILFLIPLAQKQTTFIHNAITQYKETLSSYFGIYADTLQVSQTLNEIISNLRSLSSYFNRIIIQFQQNSIISNSNAAPPQHQSSNGLR